MKKTYNCPNLDIKTFDTEILTDTSGILAKFNPFAGKESQITGYNIDKFTIDTNRFIEDSTWNQ